jgi:NitT/TauT family transport system permease protein
VLTVSRPKIAQSELARRLPPAVALVLVIALWSIASYGLGAPPYVIPQPLAVLGSLVENRSELLTRSLITTAEAIAGFGLGAAGGFLIAVLISESRLALRAVLPLAVVANAIPNLVFAPVAVLILGFGATSKLAVVGALVFFPVFSNALRGLRSLDALSVELMGSLASNRWTTLWKARIPASVGYLFPALRTSAAISISAALVAEYFGSGADGIGWVIILRIHLSDLAGAFAALGVIATLGLLFYGVVVLFERLVAPWQVQFRSTGRGR